MRLRLDQLLVERNLYKSREKAKAAIMAGIVYVDGAPVTKAGTSVGPSAEIEIRGKSIPYVSRGGLKLEKALDVFEVEVEDLVALDIGASTGGFTDCLLQNGVRKVYAIDVGYGQLDWGLRQNPRVVVMERTNIRYVTEKELPEKADIAVIDVSFISLTKIFNTVLSLLRDDAQIISLIKPQFEAGRERVGKKGVVRDRAVHEDVLLTLSNGLQSMGAGLRALDFSPITGPEGNIEYLAYFIKGAPMWDAAERCREVVAEAWHQHA